MEEHADKKIFLDGQVINITNQEKVSSSDEDEMNTVFPLARVRKIMQIVNKDGLRRDSVKIISKATVLVI